MKIVEWLKQWGTIASLLVLGMFSVGYGLWEQVKPREVVVEILRSDTVPPCQGESCRQGGEVVVDVSGAVEKPGVYKLPTNSRIGDALVLAGGLGASADRNWVAANLNLAQKLEDGEKVFIPTRDENNNQAPSTNNQTMKSENSNTKRINVNTASVGELDSLEGIGAARAQAIIDNRPYSKTEELVVKAKIPQSVYEKISTSISVY